MSRFMLQLLVESKHVISRKTIVSGQNVETHKAEVIVKTPQMMEILDKSRLITPTFLNTYLRCAKSFYYKYILSIREPKNWRMKWTIECLEIFSIEQLSCFI
mgnify:CR=1 FL=1